MQARALPVAPMIIRTLVKRVVFAAAAAAFARFVAARRQRRTDRPTATPRSLQTWESEGGAVPAGSGRTTASQVHPDDARASVERSIPRNTP